MNVSKFTKLALTMSALSNLRGARLKEVVLWLNLAFLLLVVVALPISRTLAGGAAMLFCIYAVAAAGLLAAKGYQDDGMKQLITAAIITWGLVVLLMFAFL